MQTSEYAVMRDGVTPNVGRKSVVLRRDNHWHDVYVAYIGHTICTINIVRC
jgi:hypothetical protein